ncbi:Copia protein [Durusdinium trenchii]|uniref:Copia protein n=1 Tax=Durusdinium trenchii TaxID=1381693 RepID=A0ABP0NPA9_9DINO
MSAISLPCEWGKGIQLASEAPGAKGKGVGLPRKMGFLPPTLLGVEMTLALAETGSHGFLFGLLMETFISIFTAANLLAMQTAVSAGCRPIISAAGGLVATCTSLALWQWYPVKPSKEPPNNNQPPTEAAISIRLALLWVVLLSHITDYRQRLWDIDRGSFTWPKGVGLDFGAKGYGVTSGQTRSILKVFRNIHSDFHSDALELDDILLGERDDEDDPLNCPAGLSCRRTPYSLPLILHHGRLVWLDFWDWVYLPQGTFVLMWYLLVASLWTMATDVERRSVMLVSSPGYAILDSGCGKTIIGRETLTSFREIWDKLNIPVKPEFKQRNVFRYGNGQQEVSDTMIDMPIFLAGKPGYVRAAIVQGSAPLLLSRPSMKKLKVQMNFAEDSIQLFDSQVPVPIEVNSAGQYAIKITEFPEGASKLFAPADDEPSAHADTQKLNIMEFTARQHRGKLIRKATSLLVSHHDMLKLGPLVKSRSPCQPIKNRHPRAAVMTAGEMEECTRLMVKARAAGAWPALMQRLTDIEDINADLAWSGSSAGTMGDGSKRLRDDARGGKPQDVYWSPVEPLVPPPMPAAALPTGSGYPVESLFPDGITSVDQWGATMFSFGKFKGTRSYEEVANSASSEMSSYRAFCTSHFATGSAGLKDFVKYLKARNMGDRSNVVIPGSHVPRVFKKKTEE